MTATLYPVLTTLAGWGEGGRVRTDPGVTSAIADVEIVAVAATARIDDLMSVRTSERLTIETSHTTSGHKEMTEQRTLRILRRIVAFVVAAAVMVVLGSAAHSYFVQEAWSIAAGHADGTAPAAIPFADRLSWVAHDLVGLLPQYGALTAIALFIAFLIAGVVARYSGFRVIVFGIAGAFAIFVLFAALKFFVGTVGVFGARGPIGLAAQMAVGLVAGVVFAKLTSPSASVRPRA